MSECPFLVPRQKNAPCNMEDQSVNDENTKRATSEPDAPISFQQTGQVALLPKKEVEQVCKGDYAQER